MPSPDRSVLAVVALGSNLGRPAELIREAISRLSDLSDQPLLRSSLWKSQPVDCPPGSPPFVNAVAGLVPRPGETPETLLGKLQRIEAEFGRPARRAPNDPRLLDLDLICFGRESRSTKTLSLPHPRWNGRRFVLEPLCEIAPDLVLPGQSRSVRELLLGLGADTAMERLGSC